MIGEWIKKYENLADYQVSVLLCNCYICNAYENTRRYKVMRDDGEVLLGHMNDDELRKYLEFAIKTLETLGY